MAQPSRPTLSTTQSGTNTTSSSSPARPGRSPGPGMLEASEPSMSAHSSSTSSLNINTAAAHTSSHRESPSLQPSPSPTPSASVSHRSSYADSLNLRGYPSSPRAQRQHSFSGAALQDVLMQPTAKPAAVARDWRAIHVSEIVDPAEARFVELDTTIEDTTKLLIKSGAPNVVLLRESVKTRTAIGTFDYSDLNAYLLLVLGLSQPDDAAQRLAERARSGDPIPLRDVIDHLGPRELPAFLPNTADLTQAMEVLGGGSHRAIICKEGTSEAVSVLSQLRLVRFFWDNHQSFTAMEQLYPRYLRELDLGVKHVLAINGDRPLSEALLLMHNEGITSLPVLDSHRNVVGNISHVDVRLLTDTSSMPLLSSTCIHFISVILSERGLDDGKDSYPVFYVNPLSTFAHTVAKLCATRSHRMWIVDEPSPASSVPPSPGVHHHAAPPPNLQGPSSTTTAHITTSPTTVNGRPASVSDFTPGPPYTSTNSGVSVSAAQLPSHGSSSGRLTGVVSLTDILNLFARASGLSPGDPELVRRRRRRSSSSSIRPSTDGVRPSAEFMRAAIGGGEPRRSPSASSRRGV